MTRLDPPAHLDDERRAIWAETVARLTAGGRVFRADPEILITYVEAVRSHRQASRLLAQTNVMITRDGVAMENPALAIQRKSAESMARASRSLGLDRIPAAEETPSDPATPGNPLQPPDPGRWCEQHKRHECTRQRKGKRGACHGPVVTGGSACRMHLGKEAPPVIAEARAERLLYQRDAAPVVNPLEALQLLAGRALALEQFFGDKANELKGLRYEGGAGGEQLRAEVAVLERAMDRAGRLLLDIAKLGIEDKLAGIRQRTLDMLERALDAALEASGAGLDGKAKAREAFKRQLKVVA